MHNNMNFILKTLIKQKLKGVPDDQIDMIIALVEKNPAFFKQIADEVQAKIASGLGQEEATKQVMMAHQDEVKGMMK